MTKISIHHRAYLRLFSFYLVNRTLNLELLDNIDYSAIFTEPSLFEQIIAIYCNVLETNEEGKEMLSGHAEYRVAQYIREYFDDKYVVEPPFEPWELELHL